MDGSGSLCEGIGQDLDGDLPTEVGVARAIDLAHAAGTNRRHDFVRTDASTC
jgi:hypothetical protein